MPALSARHSAMHSLAVFWEDEVLVDGDDAAAGGGVGALGLGGGPEAAGAAPPLHCSTYAFSVTPRACIPALSARHSAVHSFAVFAKAGANEMLHTTAAAMRPLPIFMFVLLGSVAR